MSRHNGTPADVTITGFTKKGHGLGKTENGKDAEVPFCIPGDTARVSLYRKRGGVYSSRFEELLKPSPLRIVPRCVHFGVCGGCRWQQMPYEEQLKIKQETIETLFRPLLGADVSVRPILACDPPWHYRNKMEFSFSNDAEGKQYLGLIIDGSRGKVLNLTECHLVNQWFVETITAVRAWWKESGVSAFHMHSNKGSLRTLTVREGMRTGDRLVMLTVSGNPDYALTRQQLDSFVAFLRDAIEPVTKDSTLSIFLRIQQAVKGHETQFYEMQLFGPDHIREVLHVVPDKSGQMVPLRFNISPSAFFQPNTMQAEKLYSTALQMLEIPPKSVVYDLYCGTGTLGICAAKNAKMVMGIEISPESSLDARGNAAENGLDNVKIFTGSVGDVMVDIRKNNDIPMPDIVMVDPPRSGLDSKTIQHLIELKPNKILYISCNPATQADNIKELQQKGYHLAALQPVDQFPHTVHIENIAILSFSVP